MIFDFNVRIKSSEGYLCDGADTGYLWPTLKLNYITACSGDLSLNSTEQPANSQLVIWENYKIVSCVPNNGTKTDHSQALLEIDFLVTRWHIKRIIHKTKKNKPKCWEWNWPSHYVCMPTFVCIFNNTVGFPHVLTKDFLWLFQALLEKALLYYLFLCKEILLIWT